MAGIDGRAGARLGLALLWPAGPLAFIATVAGLLLASLIAFPAVGVMVVLAAIGWALLG
jgi:hypothetical protein